MTYKASPIGNEITCVMHGIDSRILNDHKKLDDALLGALKLDGFKILNKISYEFNPKGYTILVMLAESHASIHTYPEYNSLVFHIYSCRSQQDARKTVEFIKEKLKPFSLDLNERPIIVKQNLSE